MYRYQKWLIVSIVFLAAALIFPTYTLYSASQTLLKAATNPDYTEHAAQTGGINAFFQEQSVLQNQVLVVVIAVEALLAAVFAATMWYAIKCRLEDLCLVYPNPTPKT